MIIRGRVPGRWHIHPMLSVQHVGPLVGPGEWIEVTGSADDFAMPLETISGLKIEDLATFNVANVVGWHVVWISIAAAWLLFWLLRPLLVPRWIVLQKGREDVLVRQTDVVVGAALVIGSLGLAAYSYVSASIEYPRVVPLQVGQSTAVRIEQPPNDVFVDVKRATYDVPGRAMRIIFDATNNGQAPLTLGEFTTASLRFVNRQSANALARVDQAFPQELVPESGLVINDSSPLQPGETRTYEIDAVDVVWELERLTSFLTDVDSRFGGLLFFYEDDGTRHLTEIAGPIIPVFTDEEDAVAQEQGLLETALIGR
jgi:methane/ammonia monooxygenase subunit B